MATTYPAYLPVLLFSLLSSACGDEGPVVTVGDVMFDDPELQQCFEQGFLPFPDDADVRLVQQLDCGLPAHDIQDLTGIEILSGLGGLNLVGQQNIDDYSPILGLPNLIGLELRESRVENKDLNIISQLEQLEWLRIILGDLGDISQLAELKSLEYISLGAAGVSSGVDSLANIPNLRTILLNGNPEVPCSEFQIIIDTFPDANISPETLEPGVSCTE